jgi:hypothetical protein
MAEKNIDKKLYPFIGPLAAPDDPIYSRGWTIGWGGHFSQLAKPSQEKDEEEEEEEPDDKL